MASERTDNLFCEGAGELCISRCLHLAPCINNNAKERRARSPLIYAATGSPLTILFAEGGREGGRPFLHLSAYRRKAFRLHFCHKQHLEADTRRRGLSYHCNKVSCIFLSGKCWSSFTTLALGDYSNYVTELGVFKRNMMMIINCVRVFVARRGRGVKLETRKSYITSGGKVYCPLP